MTIGGTISHYKITEKIGEGGMGVVYKARDTKLDRSVALKFLAPHLLQDAEGRKRFVREAKAAAALNHPNICTVYEIDEAGGETFISMAFIDGVSLDKKIEAGPLKLPEALDIAVQTARGLEAAHGKPIVHRDIKPANLMVGESSGSRRHVTIMDFGLAQLADQSKLTQKDTTLGTTAYMSPEQTQGLKLDPRTDIWALGVVLYEMVTGQLPFQGHYQQAIVYSITFEEPEPLTALRTGVPMELEWIVGKCLAKDAEKRYQSATELIVDLETLQEKLKSGKSTILRTAGSPADAGASPAAPSERNVGAQRAAPAVAAGPPVATVTPAGPRQAESLSLREISRWKWTALAAAIALATFLAGLSLRLPTPTESTPVRKFSFLPESLYDLPRQRAAISPDGNHIVYVSGGQPRKLWVRDFEREQPRELEGTEGSWHPFWSPDSRFIGFAVGGELKKIPVQGGAAITLCDLPSPNFAGGSWSPDGATIVFASPTGSFVLQEVSARGGAPKLLFEPVKSEKGPSNHSPHFLPAEAAARAILFDMGSRLDREIAVKNLETGEVEVLGEGARPIYSPSGHILYQTASYTGGLWALPFSLKTLKPTGEAFPIAENVGDATVANDGTLVYVDNLKGAWQLVWRDREGRKLGAIGQPQDVILYPALSPDGGRVAVEGEEGSGPDIWVHEVDRTLKQRLTADPGPDRFPVWSPSGENFAFQSSRAGTGDIFTLATDGGGEPQTLVSTDLHERPQDWSHDGNYLLYEVLHSETGHDLWYLKRKADGGGFDSFPFLQTPFRESRAKLSADGRVVAYCSDQSGQDEVHVREFPEGGGRKQVSENGGCDPRWRRDGKELFYFQGNALMAVEVNTAPSFSLGRATHLFEAPGLSGTGYDVSADGRRFVLVETLESEQAQKPTIHIVENWFEEFRQRQGQ